MARNGKIDHGCGERNRIINRISEFRECESFDIGLFPPLSLLPLSSVETGCELVPKANRCSTLCFLRIVIPYSFQKSQFPGINGGGKVN